MPLLCQIRGESRNRTRNSHEGEARRGLPSVLTRSANVATLLARESALPRTCFVGDVHGCTEELEDLLKLLQLTPGDRIFFLGDLVDRGPDSVGAIRRVAALLREFPGSGAIAGNHDEKALRLHEKKKPVPEWGNGASDDDWRFLDSLPLLLRIRDLGVVLVHGGFYPGFFAREGAVGELASNWRTDKSKRADRMRRFLRVRAVDAKGEMLDLEQITPRDSHWSALYDGREGFCFFGHDPQLSPPAPLRAPFATGLDTGACFGGRLTAAVIDSQEPAAATFVSVPARAPYAEPRLQKKE